MKNLLLFLALSTTILFTSCEGDPGPPGQDGGLLYAQVFEETVDFQYNATNGNFDTPYIAFPFTVYESDVVLVYRYEGQAGIGGGETADVWSPLPQNIFYNNGDIIQYLFTNTFVDVQMLIEGNFDLSTLNDGSVLDNQTFRIAVVPSEFAKTNPSMDDILEVMRENNMQIEKIED
ncbi:collagen-like protein [Aequorivita marina]|uniref:collagen-like protein n=1 Tax=Aequorivita marina TaxID=3073654 RepID=UPI00287565EF|nr:collagen-like protein [Aequorivita sp. S2608]MDS1297645.1 collagen-like protein [Aequorivita sp. S2608]